MIDSHHHFWRYSPADYGWIDDEMEVLKRDFLPGDLELVAGKSGITGVISVQACESLEDNTFLLKQANASDLVKGVVGWLPLAAPDVEAHLDRFAAEPIFKGVREVIQGRKTGEFFENEDFNRGILLLTKRDLPYDVLIFENQLEEAIRFIDRHPGQRFIVDHIAKPLISRGEVSRSWEKNIRSLARRENVMCKFSGVVTEVRDAEWSPESIKDYFTIALSAFGAERLMFGSDWPVCLLRTTYEQWLQTCRELTADLSKTEQDQFFEGTATAAYQL